jgi:hypothetical protein
MVVNVFKLLKFNQMCQVAECVNRVADNGKAFVQGGIDSTITPQST